jgi:hypothetical protein
MGADMSTGRSARFWTRLGATHCGSFLHPGPAVLVVAQADGESIALVCWFLEEICMGPELEDQVGAVYCVPVLECLSLHEEGPHLQQGQPKPV